jgi:ketosteroid isomerase-like protein
MSQENVETFRRSVEAWNRDDFGAWIDLFDPEVEWFALMEVFRGHEGARQAWRSFKEIGQLKAHFDDVRDLGESVLALGQLTTIGRTTRLNVSGEIAQLAEFRGGKIVSFRDFPSHAEALEAVGLAGRRDLERRKRGIRRGTSRARR